MAYLERLPNCYVLYTPFNEVFSDYVPSGDIEKWFINNNIQECFGPWFIGVSVNKVLLLDERQAALFMLRFK